jgi:hypothetical protein
MTFACSKASKRGVRANLGLGRAGARPTVNDSRKKNSPNPEIFWSASLLAAADSALFVFQSQSMVSSSSSSSSSSALRPPSARSSFSSRLLANDDDQRTRQNYGPNEKKLIIAAVAAYSSLGVTTSSSSSSSGSTPKPKWQWVGEQVRDEILRQPQVDPSVGCTAFLLLCAVCCDGCAWGFLGVRLCSGERILTRFANQFVL